jgi:AcrR family transcriptional regulator
MASPRERIVTAAMRLFGERGYSGTTVAQIEAAAGLSPGAGGIYRHFPSKRAILEAGLAAQIAGQADLIAMIEEPGALESLPLPDRLLIVAGAGLRRLEEEQDLNRLVMRDLSQFPELLDRVGREDIAPVFQAFAGWLRSQAVDEVDQDWDAIAMALMGAVTHFWILGDIFGRHPAEIEEGRYLSAVVALAECVLSSAHRKGNR